MAEFPSYARVLFDDYSEDFDPSVERTEMERGVPKQRTLNTHVMMNVNATLFFRGKADAAAFESWYFNDIKRIGWFNMTHPRTKQRIVARFVGGKIGTLVPVSRNFAFSKRTLVIEYLR